jgi:hypothetical protein
MQHSDISETQPAVGMPLVKLNYAASHRIK